MEFPAPRWSAGEEEEWEEEELLLLPLLGGR
jgi:hypothetical protein